jgi:inner membrane protein
LDNVSHTVAGLLLAEAAVQLRLKRAAPVSPRFARAAYWISAAANNLPDLDALYTKITAPPPLGYLLHHRGHTHTLILALALSALLVFAVRLLARRLRQELGRTDWLWLWGVALFGGAVILV